MIRPYFPGDLWIVLPLIRQSELDEAHALGEDPEQCLKYSIYAGETVTLELGGEIAGIAGVVACGEYWSPWSVFTSEVDKHPLRFLRECKRWISRYDVPMLNVVDERNVTAQKWLKFLGFTVGDPMPFGPYNMLFRHYWKNMGAQWAGQ